VRIQLMFFTQRDEIFQQGAFALDVTNRAMGGQLGLRYLNGQRAPFSQQCLQPGIDGADLIA